MPKFKVRVGQEEFKGGFVLVEAASAEEAGKAFDAEPDKYLSKIYKPATTVTRKFHRIELLTPKQAKEGYTNRYRHCNEEWEDPDCDSMHNDKCPKCNKEIEPYESVENSTGDVIDLIGREIRDAKVDQMILEHASEEFTQDGDLEIDVPSDPKECVPLVSEGDENGTYVRAWKWVSFSGTKFDHDTDAKDGEYLVRSDCSCDVCGENFYSGDTAFRQVDPEDETFHWFCEEHRPDKKKGKTT